MSRDAQTGKPGDKSAHITGKSPVSELGDLPAVDFHGAAVIDESGKEVPITEEMILTAFDSLED
jgi:hypothetical protein